jgi:hypothetical protein
VSYGQQPGHPQSPYGSQYGQPYGQAYGQGYGQQYGQQPGHPGYGPPSPGSPSPALAYVSAVVFLICGILALVTAIVGWDGQPSLDTIDIVVAMIGAAFSEEITGNVDFAVSVTMSVACSTIVFALVLFARLDFVRWLLGFIGGLVTVYYVYAMIKLLSNDGGEFIAMILVSLLAWAAATVLVLLPATGRGMRGYQRKLGQYQAQPTGYPY